MNNQLTFIIGTLIFIVYLYFYLKIVLSQIQRKKQNDSEYFDTNDFDGIGNQGRIPDKKPKNRAF